MGTFENAETKWVPEIKHYLPDVPIVFVGNKSDLKNDQNRINVIKRRGYKPLTEEEIKSRIIALGGCNFFEASAKTGENIKSAFNFAAFAGYMHGKGKQVPNMLGGGKKPKKSNGEKKKPWWKKW